ncbi:MAG: mechanosensitive ion channel family protein [Candidatus Woesearchaeota archaeon]|nr:mechanosensitive ion channel family protein [Candidatus Woesearchaeota archaeon]MDP7505890.1 mechanosensitive ion channel family protein [Candidatus Woesearchaeota archaeon]MDP7610289.1 mechanosensitive ion channel family protein [Candidatus Woesearchaeota archaeon]
MIDISALNIKPEILIKIIRVAVMLVILEVLYQIITKSIKKVLLNKIKSKRQRSNVIVFFNILRYLFIFLIILILIFTYTGSWTGLGISAGLLTAALGWALQRPITGIAAWIMVVTKKPFSIGDRIIIGSVKGDVSDITLTHIYLKEIGGTVGGEESSGRIILVPNSVLFEQNIVNYTMQDEFILSEVRTLVTYESNLDEAVKICKEAAGKVTRDVLNEVPEKPVVRTFFKDSGIVVKVRFFTKTDDKIKAESDITQAIFEMVKESKNVDIAYPHIQIVK